MKLYTWAVIQDCRIVGYIKAYGEWEALRLANKKYGERLFVERTYLGDWIGDKEEKSNELV